MDIHLLGATGLFPDESIISAPRRGRTNASPVVKTTSIAKTAFTYCILGSITVALRYLLHQLSNGRRLGYVLDLRSDQLPAGEIENEQFQKLAVQERQLFPQEPWYPICYLRDVSTRQAEPSISLQGPSLLHSLPCRLVLDLSSIGDGDDDTTRGRIVRRLERVLLDLRDPMQTPRVVLGRGDH